MKNTILIAAFLVSSMLAAQVNQTTPGKGQKTKSTPQQRAEMRTKELTLALNLSEKQAQEVQALEEKMAVKHQEKRKEIKEKRDEIKTKNEEERLKFKNEMLNDEIAHQNEMKKILSEEQFTKWMQMREEKIKERKKELRDKNYQKRKLE